jgi:hypothetical protein
MPLGLRLSEGLGLTGCRGEPGVQTERVPNDAESRQGRVCCLGVLLLAMADPQYPTVFLGDLGNSCTTESACWQSAGYDPHSVLEAYSVGRLLGNLRLSVNGLPHRDGNLDGCGLVRYEAIRRLREVLRALRLCERRARSESEE